MVLLLTTSAKQRYTHGMKLQRIVLLLILLCVSLAACSPGHTGTSEIAFIRNGQLYTIDSDGSNAFAIVSSNPAVVGYNWSPNHLMLSYRTLDSDFAKTSAALQLPTASVTGQIGDVPSTLHTIGVDGGTGIAIAFSNPTVSYSSAFWNSNSTRLLYRATPYNSAIPFNGIGNPQSATWWISQDDQPDGIALKRFPSTYSIPSVSYNAQDYEVIGNASSGIFTTSMAGTNERSISPYLNGHPLPASLERILWRPAHQNQAFLYAQVDTTPNNASLQSTNTQPFMVQLMLGTPNGHQQVLAHCACTQFAWSPDGNSILYTTGTTYTVLNLTTPGASFTFSGEADAVPYWSPNSKFLLLDGQHTLSLITLAKKQQTLLLSDQSSTQQTPQTAEQLPSTSALLQPVANSLWSSDSSHFLLLTHQRLTWQHQPLQDGQGLYTVSLDAQGHPQGTPFQIAKGNNISQVGWSYQDPNTSFLF
jgi:hypothetical protein